jgi:uncharacterized membrane protein HdeD (DUF308 family)|tara:strand:- start:653 stop:898 length:246 start_codon:yes stop_codon:yes gene_type:complete
MKNSMKDKKNFWIGGTLTAFLGVALVRLVAPELESGWASLVFMLGFTLVIAGITTLTFATKRDKSNSFVDVDGGAADQEQS